MFAADMTKCSKGVDKLDNALQIIYRAEDIVTYHLTRERLAGADLIIRPKVRRFSWMAVDHIEKIITAGEQTTEKALLQVRQISGF